MADAKRDQNTIPTLLGLSNVDGVTPVPIYADPVTHRLLVDNGSSGGGDVTGPSSSTDNAVVRFDGTTGKVIQDYTSGAPTIGDTGISTWRGNMLFGTDNTFDIGASGATRPRTVYIGTSAIVGTAVQVGNAGNFQWLSRGAITAPGDGTFQMQNNAGNDFTMLQFGGSTSAYPALLRSGAALQVRLADNSARGSLEASTLGLNSNLSFATAGAINWASGDYTLTHSTGFLTANKDFRITSANVGTNADSVPTLSSTSTLTNKTLTSPRIGTAILDTSGNELFLLTATASAVNELTYANAATGNNPTFTASGGDTDIGINFTAKGAQAVNIRGNATQAGELRIYEDTDDGTNYSAFRGSARSGNIVYTLPTADPSASQVLTAGAPSGGVAALSWTTPSSTATSTSLAPHPRYATTMESASSQYNSNTTGYTSSFTISTGITINAITFYVQAVGTNGTLKIGLYSADGQTRYCNETTGTISAATAIYTHTMSAPIALPSAGAYYLVIVPVSTADITFRSFNSVATVGSALATVTGKATQYGTQTVSAGTLPATFDPTTALTPTGAALLPMFRIDN